MTSISNPVFERYADKFRNLFVTKGTLYIVSTPIGNLEEISFRALAVLRECDFIACEDTRRTGILLQHYGIKKKLVSYYAAGEKTKTDGIVVRLLEGDTCALVSDAGTPLISDPGSMLVSMCIERNINIRAIPGSSSLIHALIMSGFPIKKFFFQGFLPQKKGRQSTISDLSQKEMLIAIFESPYRIRRTLGELAAAMGNKDASISREMTKKFEQTIRAPLVELSRARFAEKGEFVIIINNC